MKNISFRRLLIRMAAIAAASCSVFAGTLTVADFSFNGEYGSKGAVISYVSENRFKVVLGAAPGHDNWPNMLQFIISSNALGKSIRIDTLFNSAAEWDYHYNHYFSSYSYDRVTWYPLTYQNTNYSWEPRDDWIILPVMQQDKVYFGHMIPMSYEETIRIADKYKNNPCVFITNIGQSAEGRNIYRFVITDPNSPVPRTNRWGMYFSQVHPGECNAAWRNVGMMEWLLGDTEAAADARRRTICHFVLLASPDSAKYGFYRVNTLGVDMNQSYRSAGSSAAAQTPEAYVMQRDLERIMATSEKITINWNNHNSELRVYNHPVKIGSEISILGGTNLLAAYFRQSDLLNTIYDPMDNSKSLIGSSWAGGPCVQFGISGFLCEGGGRFRTMYTNKTAGEATIRGLTAFYKNTKSGEPVVPIITGVLPSLTTNKAFTITLDVTADYGYWSTNGGSYRQFTTSGVSIPIAATTTLSYYGRNAGGYSSVTNTRTYTIDMDAPTVSGVPESCTTNRPFAITLDVNENHGYWSINGGAYQQITTNGAALYIDRTTTLRYYGMDAFGNASATNTKSYAFSVAGCVYEGEIATLYRAGIAANQSGYTGTGFIDFFNEIGSSAAWNITAGAAKSYTAIFRYANGITPARPCAVSVNGIDSGTVMFEPTGSWASWRYGVVETALAAGAYAVKLMSAVSNGGPNVDSLMFGYDYEGEEAAIIYRGVVATNWTGFCGKGFLDLESAAGSYAEWNVVSSTAQTVTILVRYANGLAADRPCDIVVNGTAVGRNTFVSTGNWTDWKYAHIAVPFTAGVNSIRFAAASALGAANIDKFTVVYGIEMGAVAKSAADENTMITPQADTVSVQNIPFRGVGNITFLNVPQGASARIYSLSGMLIAEVQSSSSHELSWNGRASDGSTVKPGVYFCQLSSSQGIKIVKIMVKK
ncbi:MAG: T9SS type A sorting domain-containing protein [Spirochaetes bacterium]|nr:T9SS type A sorting domain-containing protein [Spirochaetota bacterium]